MLGVVARRLGVRAFGGRSATIAPSIPPAHRLDRSRSLDQEGGEAKIASGWPPCLSTLPGSSPNPGRTVNAHCVQASVSQRLASGTRSRRRFVPPSPSVSVSQSMNQRWRERPRCPALRVTPGRRDGVVHAIVGRVARRRFRAVNVPDETRRPCARLRVEIRQKNTTRETHRNLFWRVEGISGRSVTVTDADPGVAPSRS